MASRWKRHSCTRRNAVISAILLGVGAAVAVTLLAVRAKDASAKVALAVGDAGAPQRRASLVASWKALRLSGKWLVGSALVGFALIVALSVATFVFGLGFAPGHDGHATRNAMAVAVVAGPMGIPPFFMVASYWLRARDRRANWIDKDDVQAVLITEGAVLVSNLLAALFNKGEVNKGFILIQMGTVFGLMLVRSVVSGRSDARKKRLPRLLHRRTDNLWAALAVVGLIGGAILVPWAWSSERGGSFTSSLTLLGTGVDVVGAVLMAAVTKYAQFGSRIFRLAGWRDVQGSALRVTLRSCGKMVVLAVGAGYLSISVGLWGTGLFEDHWSAYHGMPALVISTSVFLLALKGTVGDFLGTFLALRIMSGEEEEYPTSEELLIQ